MLPGNKDPPDRGAFLSGFQRHLAHDFFYEEVEQVRSRSGVRPENRGVEAVRFYVDTDGAAQNICVRANARRRVRRASEGNDVALANMIQKIARRAAQNRD